MRLSLTFLSLLAILTFTRITHATEPLATVPFVGCPADGQLGPVEAPKGPPKYLPIQQNAADRLAWYQAPKDASGLGTLGPREWHCFATYGSSGSAIYVAPEPLNAGKLLFGKNWKGFTGPAVELSLSLGDTSGRFEVARVIARAFPAHRDFLRNVIAEGLEPTSDFPTDPFPSDHLTYKTKELVEFTTPADHKGLGTMSRLLPSDQAISGMAFLTGEETNLIQLNVRLPPTAASLTEIIVREAEQQTVKQ